MFVALLLRAERARRFGLQMRAVTQNRRMASAMGIRTARVDALTFGLGSGIAGIAGVALSQIDNVSPNLGQSYIIDSFMVVVFGGVGNLWGTLVGALTLGVANKFLEPYAGAVLGKIAGAGLHHPVHPEAPARPVRAQGPGGGSMIDASAHRALIDRRGRSSSPSLLPSAIAGAAAATCCCRRTSPLHVPTYIGGAARQVSLLRHAGARRSIWSGAIAASSRSATAPSSRSAAMPWACT